MEKDKNSIIINLIGVGCKVSAISLEEPIYSKLYQTAKELNEPLKYAIFDADFFNLLNDKKYTSLDDMAYLTINGLIENIKSTVEIRLGGRKKRTISMTELIKQDTLLPLYQIEIIEGIVISKNTLIVIEKEMGLIYSYQIKEEKLDIDKLNFKICDVITGNENLKILSSMEYDGKKLISKPSDTLITASYAIQV
jgi:hypothetical protein